MVEVPAIVKRNRFVRRGSVDVPPFVLDEKGSAVALQRLADERAAVLAILDEPGTPEHFCVAGRAWLDGDPESTPLAAAAAVAALAGCVQYPEDSSILVPFADVWIARHGLLFAVRAAVEHTMLVCQERPRMDPRHRGDLYLAPVSPAMGGYRGPLEEILLRLRAAIAVATETEYAELVETLRPTRDRHWMAAVATDVLLPGERDWVEHDVRAAFAHGSPSEGTAAMLLLAAGTAAQAAALAPHVNVWTSLRTLRLPATVADGVGPGAAGALLAWFDDEYAAADVRRRMLSVLVELDDDAVFEELIARIGNKYLPAAVLDAAARFPARAMRLLAEAGSPLLRSHVLSHLDLVDEVLPALGPAAAERVREVAASTAAVAHAPLSAVPAVLADPPWRDRAKAAKPAVITGLTCDDPETVEWREGEREQWRRLGRAARGAEPWERIVHWVTTDSTLGYVGMLFSAGPQEIVRPLLRTFRSERSWYLDDWVKAVAARFELEALPFVRDAAERSIGQTDALLPYSSPSIAVFMADRLARPKSARPAALAWLLRHADSAARALIPDALGKAGVARRQAEAALLTLPTATVRAAAASYGSAASAAISALLTRDPLTLLPARLPVNPAWAVPVTLPPVRLRDGSGTLPPAAVDALITMLAMSELDNAYAGIDLVVAACEPDDLAEFAWGLFEGWRLAGADVKQGWVFDALALLGDDATVRRLAPLILAWPGEGGHTKAVAGVRALAAIGSDVALMRLYGIAQRAKFKGLKTAAEDKMAEVADSLALTTEQLADRLVPDFGLAADGSMTLDYGSRQFVAGFDEQLRPFITDTAGRRLKTLPKPSTPLAEAAWRQFGALKKDVRTVAADQVRRLEQAMVTGRRWTPEEFTRYFAGHPLLWHIVRRLVWTVSDGGSFRVAEDRSYADVADEQYKLPGEVTVGVAHPLDLGDDLIGWSEVFADYEILQPFPQLTRDVHEATEENVKLLLGVEIPTTRVLGLERRGWRREAPQDAGIQGQIERTVGDRTVAVELDPGIAVGEPDALGDQTLKEVYVHDGSGHRWSSDAERQPLSTLSAAAASEVLRDLTMITGSAGPAR